MAGVPGNGRPRRNRTYKKEYAARKIRGEREGLTPAQARGHGGGARQARAALRTEAGLRSATPAQLRFRNDELEALRRVRAGDMASVRDAERLLGLPRGSVRRDCPTAFDSRGRLKAADREAALMVIAGPDGDERVIVRGSRARSMVGRHRIAVDRFLRDPTPENEAALRKFYGKKVGGIELETDGDRLEKNYPRGLPDVAPYAGAAVR